ncbi:hypothetical protein [Nostoc sp.]
MFKAFANQEETMRSRLILIFISLLIFVDFLDFQEKKGSVIEHTPI